MSNLTDLLPAGAGGKQVDFVASGTLSSGQTIALKSNGTVEAISETFDPATSVGSPVAFYSGIGRVSSTYDSNAGKIVVCYTDSATGALKCSVGTVSGSTISFGAAVTVFSGSNWNTITFDSTNNKVVISYWGTSGYINAIVGTVSGTSISFGTPTVVFSSNSQYYGSTFDSNNGKVILTWQDIGSANAEQKGIVGTVSGTGISFGSAINATTEASWCNVVYEPNSDKVIFTSENFATGTKSYMYTVSGTSLTNVWSTTISSSRLQYISSVVDTTNNKVIITGRNINNSNYGTTFVGTISGSIISYGSGVVFSSSATLSTATSFDSSIGRVVVSYQDSGNTDDGKFIVGTVSGTSISFGSSTTFDSVEVGYLSSAFDSAQSKVVTSYKNAAGSQSGDSVVITAGSLTSNNTSFIGITDAAIADTASGSVTIKGGISTNVTGLTPNQNYYVQADGTLATTSSTVLAGKALSSTSINLDYTT